MRPPAGSSVRAALLAAAMSFGTAVPADPLRLLRVPAIHFVLRRRTIFSRIWRREPARRQRWR
ncbi:MAG TPA: hypothetical protein VGE86_08345 [Thermoanaerobaculia bacterium]